MSSCLHCIIPLLNSKIHVHACISHLHQGIHRDATLPLGAVPENRDASVSSGKRTATHCKFHLAYFDGFGVEKTTFDFFREIQCVQAKHCSVPENRDASI